MSNSTIEKKQSKEKLCDNGKTKIVVSYGFVHIEGNSEPYFSITCSVYEKARNNKWVLAGCGMQHDLIAKKFPSLKPLIIIHDWKQNTGLPTYYVQNGKFFYECALGIKDWNEYTTDECLNLFKNFINLQPNEVIPDTNIEEWLESRKPMLKDFFEKIITEFKIEKII